MSNRYTILLYKVFNTDCDQPKPHCPGLVQHSPGEADHRTCPIELPNVLTSQSACCYTPWDMHTALAALCVDKLTACTSAMVVCDLITNKNYK